MRSDSAGHLADAVPGDLADLRPPRPGRPRGFLFLVEAYLWTARTVPTRRAYAQDLRAYLGFLDAARIGPRGALRVGRPTAEAFVSALSARGEAPATIRRRLSVVRTFHDFAVDAGWTSTPNAWARVRPPRGSAEPRHPGLSLPEGRLLLERAARAGPLAQTAVVLGATLGLRAAEVVGLRREDVVREHGRLVLRVRGKGAKEATVPVPGPATSLLSAYLRRRGPAAGPLLRDATGPVTYSRFYRLVRRLSREAGLSPRTPHDLRRGACGGLLDLGVDVREAQRLLRHSSIETTIRYDVRRRALDASPSDRLAARLLARPGRRPS